MAAMWAAGSAIAGGLIGKAGQSSANRTNINLSREQMKFQERMSNTAHQREAKDLELAGLNRILSIKQTGASTPPGAMAQVKNENEYLQSSAMQIAQIQNLNANTNQTNAQTDIITPKAKVYKEIGTLIGSGITEIKNFINKPAKIQQAKSTKGTIQKIAKHLGLSTKETMKLIVSKFKNFKGSPKELEQALVKFLTEYKTSSINIREN